ncbi:hypothetical protein ACWOE5_04290 [Aerococcus sanguinicola]|uniref:Uncharacterized protein n=1 Tax=Aerococcus sanguinicola TaxID=119206 RepID=A0A0X8FBH1_9LACT|nr:MULTISPECIES: hypothetical protein [Aerococcus]AMB94262.1 hypothetical protein AWM72_05570 [Aerococcus sanguinicola]MDK7049958.1 hypothetical protein [Aerococcus sanguinicola]OFT92648.1 hypothetical protein HMPREF3090_08525 [Aerococcus sp. HMSC23C02]PKZ22438.1 hypothetical protein CYJ28_04805 [Aerococcus sanguinicola]
MPTIYKSTYELDPSIGSLFIEFTNNTSGEFGEYEIPEDTPCMIQRLIGDSGEDNWIEIINPEEFLTNPFFDDFTVNQYNIKQLIKASKID